MVPLFISITEEDICYGHIKYKKRFQQAICCHPQVAIGSGRGATTNAALGGVADAGCAEYGAAGG